MGQVTLELYKEQERRLAATEGRRGYRIHALVTAVVAVVLVVVNIFAAPEFPWSAFAVAGMLVGLWFHWYFGVHRGDEFLRRHQDEVEHEAEHLRAA